MRIVIPVIMGTKNARSKIKEMNENGDSFTSAGHSASATDGGQNKSASNTSSAKGDYIDFEEIK